MTTELENNPENVKEPKVERSKENKITSPPKPAPQITNPEGDNEVKENPKRSQVNKKSSAMSKNTKENRKIEDYPNQPLALTLYRRGVCRECLI